MKLTGFLLLATLAGLPALAAAHGHDDGGALHIDAPWSREMPPTAPTAAVYFTVRNEGAADRLLGAATPAAGKAELHEHLHQNGLMKMQQVTAVDIPANGSVAFAPMGYHVMLFDLPKQHADGERFPLTLRFEHAGEVQVEVPVLRDPPASQGQGMQYHGH